MRLASRDVLMDFLRRIVDCWPLRRSSPFDKKNDNSAYFFESIVLPVQQLGSTASYGLCSLAVVFDLRDCYIYERV